MNSSQDMIIASQIAYLNINMQDIDKYQLINPNKYPSIREILINRCEGETNVYSGKREEAYKTHYCYREDAKGMNEIEPFIDGILGIEEGIENDSNLKSSGNVFDLDKNNCLYEWVDGKKYYKLDCSDWKVLSVQDANDSTGFYAVTLITGEHIDEQGNVKYDVTVSFRGSESMDNTGIDLGCLLTDWVVSDAGLLKGEATPQAKMAGNYLARILENPMIENVMLSGHSLGGNLAFTAAVLNADNANAEKIKDAFSFDGPGYTEEFRGYYASNIEKIKDKLHHRYYTIVGQIFEQYTDDSFEIATIGNGKGGFGSHSLYNICIKNEEVERVYSTKNIYGVAIRDLSNYIDRNEIIEESLIRGLLNSALGMADVALLCEEFKVALEDKKISNEEQLLLGMNIQKILAEDIPEIWGYMSAFNSDKGSKLLLNSVELMSSLFESVLLLSSGNTRSAIIKLSKKVFGIVGEQVTPILPAMYGLNIFNSFLEGGGEYVGEQLGEKLGEIYCNFFNLKDSGNSVSVGINRLNGIGTVFLSNLVAVVNSYVGMIGGYSGNYLSAIHTCCGSSGNLFQATNLSSLNMNSFVKAIFDLATSFKIKIDGMASNIPFVGRFAHTETTITPFFFLKYFSEYIDGDALESISFDFLNDIVKQRIESNNVLFEKNGVNNIYGKWLGTYGNKFNYTFKSNCEGTDYYDFFINEIRAINDIFISSLNAVRYNPDPLVLDLDADGVSLLSKQLGVYFDEDAQGLREKTQWISAEDALLAIDLNNNGIIDGGDELFGTSTVLADGSIARTGFEALLQYDSNSDGIIDSRDEIFERLLVWRDQNIDGITDDGELESLVSHGIESISLNAESEETGRRSSIVRYSDGHEARITEVDFEADYFDSREKETLEISDAIKELPNIQAIGNIPSLHSLMQQDESGELTCLVEAFMEAETVDEREAVCTQIIYRISGADAIEAGSRGTEFDAKKLAVIEAFMGRAFVGTAGNNPVNTAASILSGVYDSLFNLYYGLLAKESVLKPYLPLLHMYESDEGERYIDTKYFDFIARFSLENGDDLKNVIPEMARFIAAMNPDNPDNLVDFANKYMDFEGYAEEFSKCRLGITIGTSEGDSISAGNDVDRILAGLGNDVVYGNNGNDDIYGNGGDDTLYGENGDDVLIGESGNDCLEGGSGSDTYVFNLGDGVDTVYDYEYDMTPQDRILFGEGISSENVRMERRGNNLVVWYSENDSFTVKDAYRDYYGTGRYFVESIEFSDGTVWGTEDIANKANQILGTDENDTLEGFSEAVGYHQNETFRAGTGNDRVYASNGDDILYGEEGEDTLYGESGDDTLVGGAGSDRLEGGEGSDTYVFNLGDGVDTVYDYEYDMTPQDRILFGEGIAASDVRIERRGNNLVVWYSENDSFTVKDAYRDYYGTGRYFVESIEFSDGTVWETEDIANKANQILGTDGNDTLEGFGEAVGYHQNETFRGGAGNDRVYASNGDDILYGEEGDDTLYGESGDDTLIGGVGSDRLEGGEGSDTYVFNLGDGVDTVYDYEYDMTPQDRILFGEGIAASDVRIERRGNNLVVWYSENDSFTVKDAYRDYYGTGRYFVEFIEFADGTVWNTEDIANKANQILGTDGNDTLEGFSEAVGYHQNETFRGGAGNDRVYASNGDDILYGEEGDDTLYGESGDDTLIGGVGSDRLEGGEGSDTYVFNLGDGVDTVYDYEYDMTPQDRILFGEGISSENVRMERRGNNLVVWYSENDSFTVKDAYRDYYGTGRYFVESIEFSDGIVWNTEDIANKANQILGTDENDTLEGFNEAVGYHQNETFRAGAGNDRVYASNGDDILYGEEGEDTLYGESGDDTLVGGEGSDRLEGGEGSDTYVFNLGDGVDTVYDYEYDMTPQDRILFGEGISASDVRIERRGNNLVVWYSENDSFTVKDAYRDYYGTGRYFVESIEFSDGIVWNTEDIANKANQILGTDENDTLEGFNEAVGYHQNETFRAGAGNDRVYASNGDDILYGEEGEDTLYGESGDDTLVGGEGSDRLEGGEGSDTYIFNLGDGVDTVYDYEYDMTPQDRILFGEGISSENVHMERSGNNLVVWYSENDSFTVKDAYRDYYGTGRYFVESIEFSDGTVWDTEDIANMANQILGTDGNDTLEGFSEAVGYHQNETFRGGAGNDRVYASNGDDTIYGEDGDDTLYGEDGADILVGGAGNDRLDGGVGNDTYVFNKGDGIDTIFDYEYSDTSGKEDRILFGSGISIEDISLERTGNNLVIKYGETDQVTIDSAYRDYYGIGKYQIERVEFENGTKTVIDYDNESLTVVYQPEPEEEVIEEIEELQEGSEALEESLELYDVDAVVSVMEEVLNGEPVVESDEEISQEESGTVALAETTDIEAERMTNLLIQEMSGADSDNISDKSELDLNPSVTDELLWAE